MKVSNLINKITPIYNEYRKNSDIAVPTDQIIRMWKIGDEIKKYLNKTKIAPHKLYREIYGKSESSSNVSQRSYITREFLGRSYRVRNMFETQSEIKKTFPNLTGFSHFREAMPFFDNPKHKLLDQEYKELLSILNSYKPNTIKTKLVKQLLKKKIGIKNPRTQRLSDWQEEKDLFVRFYNELYNTINEFSFIEAREKLNCPSNRLIKVLAQNTGALSADGLKMNQMDISDSSGWLWKEYTSLVERLIKKESPVERRRFRRLVPADRLMRLSEMLYALTDDQSFNNFKNK